MRKTLGVIAIALIALVLLSGCLRGDGDGNGVVRRDGREPGIAITNFKADFASIDAGETMALMVDFQNEGDHPATDIKGTLIRKGVFGVSTLDDTTSVLDEPLEDVFSTYEFLWDITAPSVSEDRTEELQARISYNYTTEGYATIHFVPRDMLREKGKETFQLNSYSTFAPVSIEMESTQPYSIWNASDDVAEVQVKIILKNVGDGRVESATDNITLCDNRVLDCIDKVEVYGHGPTCEISGVQLSQSEEGVKLIQEEKGTWPLTLNFDITDPNAETSCAIRVTAHYRYRVDSSVLALPIETS